MEAGSTDLSLLLLKKMSSVLSSSTLRPAFVSHSTHLTYLSRRMLATSSQSHPQAKIAPLSIYIPNNVLFQPCIRCRRGDVYIMESTGETGKPCGVPTSVSRGSDDLLLNLRCTEWLVRKDLHQLMSSGAKPRFTKTLMSLLRLILSKNPWMSNNS